MKDAAECREKARECRRLAQSVGEEQRRQFLTMAEIWEDLARDRELQGSTGLSTLAPTTTPTDDDSGTLNRA